MIYIIMLNNNIPLNVNIISSQQEGKPIIELRRRIFDINIIKTLLSCAFHDRPILILPSFSDKLKSVSTLVDKGILKPVQNKDGSISYEFLI